MGEAKRRGTREQRIAQAAERERLEEMERIAAGKAAQDAEAERIQNLPPEIRKEVLLQRSSPKHRSMLFAAALAMAATSTTAKRP